MGQSYIPYSSNFIKIWIRKNFPSLSELYWCLCPVILWSSSSKVEQIIDYICFSKIIWVGNHAITWSIFWYDYMSQVIIPWTSSTVYKVMPTRKLSNSGRQNCLFAKGLEGILGCIHAAGFMILWFLLLMLLNVTCVPCCSCLFNISSYLSRVNWLWTSCFTTPLLFSCSLSSSQAL